MVADGTEVRFLVRSNVQQSSRQQWITNGLTGYIGNDTGPRGSPMFAARVFVPHPLRQAKLLPTLRRETLAGLCDRSGFLANQCSF